MSNADPKKNATIDEDEAVYLIFDGEEMKDIEKIPVHDITLIDIRERPRHRGVVYGMIISIIAVGLLVACELIFDVTWISETTHQILSGLCIALVTSAYWLMFAKRYEVDLTLTSGERRLLR